MGINWTLLREQKRELVQVIAEQPENDERGVLLTGVLHLLDFIQDSAVKLGEATEEEVFGS